MTKEDYEEDARMASEALREVTEELKAKRAQEQQGK